MADNELTLSHKGISGPGWEKSTLSAYNGNCLEVIALYVKTKIIFIGLRNSHAPLGPKIVMTVLDWMAWCRLIQLNPEAFLRSGTHELDPVSEHGVIVTLLEDDTFAVQMTGPDGAYGSSIIFTRAEWEAAIAGITRGELSVPEEVRRAVEEALNLPAWSHMAGLVAA